MTKTKDLRSMSREDLNSKLIELRKELIKHNAQIATGTTPKSPGQVKEIKKTIAKILTIVGTQTTKGSDSARTQRASKLEEQKSSSAGTQKEEEKAPEKEEPKKVQEKQTEEKING